MYNLEKEIKERLERLGWSIEKLANKTGTTKVTIHRIFNTNDVKLSLLTELAKAFGEPVSALIGEIELDRTLGAAVKEEKIVQSQSIKEEQSNNDNQLKGLQEKIDLLEKLLESKDQQIKLLNRELERYTRDSDTSSDNTARQTG